MRITYDIKHNTSVSVRIRGYLRLPRPCPYQSILFSSNVHHMRDTYTPRPVLSFAFGCAQQFTRLIDFKSLGYVHNWVYRPALIRQPRYDNTTTEKLSISIDILQFTYILIPRLGDSEVYIVSHCERDSYYRIKLDAVRSISNSDWG